MNAKKPSEEDQEPQPAPARPKEPAPESGEVKGERPYQFRFLPADPKNNLEFEDMADK